MEGNEHDEDQGPSQQLLHLRDSMRDCSKAFSQQNDQICLPGKILFVVTILNGGIHILDQLIEELNDPKYCLNKHLMNRYGAHSMRAQPSKNNNNQIMLLMTLNKPILVYLIRNDVRSGHMASVFKYISSISVEESSDVIIEEHSSNRDIEQGGVQFQDNQWDLKIEEYEEDSDGDIEKLVKETDVAVQGERKTITGRCLHQFKTAPGKSSHIRSL